MLAEKDTVRPLTHEEQTEKLLTRRTDTKYGPCNTTDGFNRVVIVSKCTQ